MFHGMIPVWKACGMTSHDVVFKLRKLLRMKKIGHTGTLDPQVDGVLVVCLGEATKLVELLMDGDKLYRGEITLGIATETEDAHGAEIERQFVSAPLSNAQIDQAMATFQGELTQIPPYYSAVKVNGKRLYEYARQGLEVERPIRQARIDYFKRTSEPIYENGIQRWSFEVQCGKGTYVRTLAVDLGAQLGYPSHMSQLTRYATGGFTKEQAFTLQQLADLHAQGDIATAVYPIESALQDYPQHELSEQAFRHVVCNGQVVAHDYFGFSLTEPTALYYDGLIRAIYAPHPTKKDRIKPIRMFNRE
ncbi:tRNA pseudouridine(55) synthase TruB [Aerococcaceae bacterium NML160702]|nr:tRNA pseudouridine(55) synthase TruB [Aerococcaceae bacterium NML190938]MCW6677239.1 tRNA pseudouridine(55) synthase TruB [Aerococcaceae bacterium NML180378]MCW6681189.1 tRNA pseudouridine(55) synthase TruB [Aerococcaceae bacterium NML130460]MCW6683087.1 tRNA pseudouridine(55) synthase TruB [Aerococcaceae bacterium NML160702]